MTTCSPGTTDLAVDLDLARFDSGCLLHKELSEKLRDGNPQNKIPGCGGGYVEVLVGGEIKEKQ